MIQLIYKKDFLSGLTLQKSAIFLGIFLLFFSEVFRSAWGGMGYADELLVILFFIIGFLSGQSMRTFPVIFLLPILLVVFGVFISLFNYYDGLGKILIQSFINFKLFFLWIGLFLLFRLTKIDAGYILFFLWWVSFFGFSLNFIFLDDFYSFFGGELSRERFGITRVQGFQLKPNDLAIFLALFCFYINFLLFDDSLSPGRYGFYFLFSLAMVFFTGSRVGLLGVVLSIFSFIQIRRLSSLILLGAFLIFILFYLLSDVGQAVVQGTLYDISHFYHIEQTKYIRVIMLYYGFDLASEYFPIGVGAGNFGTVLSQGSQVYSDLGISHLTFFEDFWGIYDSNLASLLGEYGFIFTCIVIFAYIKIVFSSNIIFGASLERRSSNLQNIFVILFSMFVMLTNPFFMHHYTAVCLFLYLAARGQRLNNKECSFGS